jgi:ribulose-5-phosphate 4-epimerase/fuculose-1-phosphate aldolase
MNSNVLDESRREIALTATHLAYMGWSEANAGNISLLMPEGVGLDDEDDLVMDQLQVAAPALAGRTFLVTTMGSRFRRLERDMLTDIIPMHVDDSGTAVGRPRGSRKPTSEFGSHILALAVGASRGWETACLVHTHSTNMLALSSSELPGEMLEEAVGRAHPEVSSLLRRGVKFLDFMAPASWEIGSATADLFENADCVVWRKHGILGLGSTLDIACDAVEVVEKAARLLLLEKAAFDRFFGLKDRELKKLY